MSQAGFISQTGASDVTGPGSATDRAIAIFNGTSGKVIQNSLATIDAGGVLSTPGLVSTASASFSGTMQYDGIAAGYASSQAQWRQAGVQTTDATPTDLISIALAEGEMVILEARIGSVQSDFSDGFGSFVYAAARRAAGGNVTLVGTPIINILESDAATDVSVIADTVGQNIKIQVTGIAAQTWNWVSTHRYHKVLTNA